ncbi:unnamed protein product [Caenorhabditis angaria]|uniref:Uncharacterized protein n=1 Tax=Caenorhabditis angaria TaxID=860376 RepID=A0A9P1N965_9PELO|nr:unnamed protein product [Caenorhabditis angaria]
MFRIVLCSFILLYVNAQQVQVVRIGDKDIPYRVTIKRYNSDGVEQSDNTLGVNTFGLIVLKYSFFIDPPSNTFTKGKWLNVKSNDESLLVHKTVEFDKENTIAFFYTTYGKTAGDKVIFAVGNDVLSYVI